MTYFRAWTGDIEHADADVVHASKLCPDGSTWEAGFRHWLRRLPCEETKRHIGNFLSVYRVRGSSADAQNSDNDVEDETRVKVTAATLATSLQTRQTDETRATAEDTTYQDLETTWQCAATAHGADARKLTCAQTSDLKALLREARRPRDAATEASEQTGQTVRVPCVDGGPRAKTETVVNAWLEEVAERVTEDGRQVLNVEQLEFVRMIKAHECCRSSNRERHKARATTWTANPCAGCYTADREPAKRT